MRQPKDIIINGVTLKEILKLHKIWLDGSVGGKRANLQYANLQYADLKGANLRDANLQYTYLQYADLRDADLQDAKLKDTNLKNANLKGANLDYSCMPLWCGDLKANYDDKQIIQQLFHVMSHIKNSDNASEEIKELLNETNLKWANKFHRVKECGEV